MNKKPFLWVLVVLALGLGVYAILPKRTSAQAQPVRQKLPAYSLSQGPMGMVGGSTDFRYSIGMGNTLFPEELTAKVQAYLDQQNDPDLALARLREYRWVYQAAVVEASTGIHAFDLMVGKALGQISPKAGPNILWNTKYGYLGARIGGGYGMLGQMLPYGTPPEMSISECQAREIAVEASGNLDDGLELADDTPTFYGFYQFHVVRDSELVGEIDVNGYTSQAWYVNWDGPQFSERSF